MNKYELVTIVDPNLNKKQITEVEEKTKDAIERYSKMTDMKDKGIKRLAYEVKNNKKGHYYIYQFEVEEKNNRIAVPEIERFCRITDKILKFITVKVGGETI